MSAPREAETLSRYLLGRAAPPELAARYERALDALGLAAESAADAAICDFALRRSWALGPLDAALGLFRPGALLRRKLLLAASILEASPEFADAFLPRAMPSSRLALELIVCGLRGGAKLAAGLAILPLARVVGGGGEAPPTPPGNGGPDRV